jgi:putative copper export protein/nitrogen fixation protein FixH
MINLFLRVTAFTQSLNGSGVDLSALLQVLMHTSYGYLWLARVLLLGIAISILLWQRRRQQRAEGTVALRKALRLDHLPEIAVSPQAARFQARVTGAVVASSTSTTRNTTVALPRSNSGELSETALPPSPSRIPFGWLVLAGLLLLTLVLSNEIVQLTTLPLSAGIFLWLSLVAQAVWLGTLAYLGITFLPVLPVLEPDHHVEILITVLKRSLPFLCSAVGVLLVSELFLSEATLQTPAQLLDTPYGMALLIRGILLLLACLLTGWLLCFLLPGLQRQAVLLPVVQADLPARRARKFALEKTVGTIRGVLRVVAALTAGSLLCVALMDFFAPPVVFPAINYAALVNSQVASSGSSSAGASLQTLQTQQAGGLSATLQTLPAHVGMTNTVIVTLSDAQGQPVSNASITLHITMQTMDMGETSSMLENRSNGVYIAVLQAGQTLSMAGPWTFQAVIAWPGHTSVQMVFHITMTT